MTLEGWIVLGVLWVAGSFALCWLLMQTQRPVRTRRDWKSYDPRFRRFL